MEDIWFGNAFQIFEAANENNLEVAMVVLRIDVANVRNVLYNFWKERVLLRSFQYYF